MTSIATQRFNKLAGSIAEIKDRVRTALATELAGAVGTAVRDILVVALIDRITSSPTRSYTPGRTEWRDDPYDRDPWGDPDDEDDERYRIAARYEDDDEDESAPVVPTAAALAVGVNVGRWWLSHRGTLRAAIGFGALTTVLGLAGGPFARAALAVIAAASDVLTAESALARLNHS